MIKRKKLQLSMYPDFQHSMPDKEGYWIWVQLGGKEIRRGIIKVTKRKGRWCGQWQMKNHRYYARHFRFRHSWFYFGYIWKFYKTL
jgi:hypothetical protein